MCFTIIFAIAIGRNSLFIAPSGEFWFFFILRYSGNLSHETANTYFWWQPQLSGLRMVHR